MSVFTSLRSAFTSKHHESEEPPKPTKDSSNPIKETIYPVNNPGDGAFLWIERPNRQQIVISMFLRMIYKNQNVLKRVFSENISLTDYSKSKKSHLKKAEVIVKIKHNRQSDKIQSAMPFGNSATSLVSEDERKYSQPTDSQAVTTSAKTTEIKLKVEDMVRITANSVEEWFKEHNKRPDPIVPIDYKHHNGVAYIVKERFREESISKISVKVLAHEDVGVIRPQPRDVDCFQGQDTAAAAAPSTDSTSSPPLSPASAAASSDTALSGLAVDSGVAGAVARLSLAEAHAAANAPASWKV